MDNNATSKIKEQEKDLRGKNVSLSVFFSIHIFSLLHLCFMLLIISLSIGLKS
jgi:hypothetical protein